MVGIEGAGRVAVCVGRRMGCTGSGVRIRTLNVQPEIKKVKKTRMALILFIAALALSVNQKRVRYFIWESNRWFYNEFFPVRVPS
jgi:hypothetical protein